MKRAKEKLYCIIFVNISRCYWDAKWYFKVVFFFNTAQIVSIIVKMSIFLKDKENELGDEQLFTMELQLIIEFNSLK